MALLLPTVEQQRRIDDEVPPDPEMRKKDIIVIKEWLSKQPHLPKHMDDAKLERFLFGCKNSIERCKMILERYYSARTALPEFFASRNPCGKDIIECCEAVDYVVLPSLTDEGHRVTILKLKDFRLEKFSLQAMTRRIVMVQDIRLMEERCLSNVMVIDLKGFSAGHFSKCTPTLSIVRKAMLAIQDSMPFRLHKVIYINAPSFIGRILNIFYPLLKEKLIQKFRIHTEGHEALYQYMKKDILPKEWGGNAGSFTELNDAWQRKIEKQKDWFLRDEKISRTNENLRIPTNKPSIFDELDGVQGTFRKLNID